MTLKEALRQKKRSIQDMNLKINSWSIYGEDSVVVFYENWECKLKDLDKLLDYHCLVDKLVVALPSPTTDDLIFQIANLQVVDGIVLYEDLDEAVKGFSQAKLAFEGTKPESNKGLKNRILAL